MSTKNSIQNEAVSLTKTHIEYILNNDQLFEFVFQGLIPTVFDKHSLLELLLNKSFYLLFETTTRYQDRLMYLLHEFGLTEIEIATLFNVEPYSIRYHVNPNYMFVSSQIKQIIKEYQLTL